MSTRSGIDVDYTFAQVATDGSGVDTGPSCGNMLAGVGPYAIETGLVTPRFGETTVRIHDCNTGSTVEAVVQTPGGKVAYAGGARIDGVPGTAAPIALNFANVVGSKTAAMLPTGHVLEDIDGIEVTLLDIATPMMLIRAEDLGLAGHETPAEIDAQPDLMHRVEAMRLIAGHRMGLGDVSGSVIPKVGLLSRPQAGGAIASRYLTPWRAHTAPAVTGAICVAAATVMPGIVAFDLAMSAVEGIVEVEHPAGKIAITLELGNDANSVSVKMAGLLRTARLLMRGEVMIPGDEQAGAAIAA